LVSIPVEIPSSLKESSVIKLVRDRVNPVPELMFHKHKILFTDPSRGNRQTICLLELYIQRNVETPPEGSVIDDGVQRAIGIL
jgi:predicted methyltransferase